MSNNSAIFNVKRKESDWLTIQEAIHIANELTHKRITEGDIYRNALCANIFLSIYFPSPVSLRKISTANNKIKLKLVEDPPINRLCHLDSNCFLNETNLIVSTEGKYISPPHRIIDTPLLGHEYVAVQRLLAESLNIPLPVTGANDIIYGISVTVSGESFLLFEKVTWPERITQQIIQLPINVAQKFNRYISSLDMSEYNHKAYFPLYHLPQDACFVIRYTELEKLINIPVKNQDPPPSSPRISTPLSRLFWLACKHNEDICPLIRQPYKLLSIFEQWASAEGITDRLSGDTLKTALERGSPSSISAPN